jgi:hypothetical protein
MGFVILSFLIFIPLLSSCSKASTSPIPIKETDSVSFTDPGSTADVEVSATQLPSSVAQESTQEEQVEFQPGLPLAIFASDHFVGSSNCGFCHTDLTDQAGENVSIDTHWRSAMMANSAKDPFWQAKVSSEVIRNPGLRSVIEDKCANCHTPMAHTEITAGGESVFLLDDGVLNPNHPKQLLGVDGVSCTLCHQIQDVDLGEESSFSGGYLIDTNVVAPDRPIFGPFPDQFEQLMMNMVGYKPVFGGQTVDSGLCGTCHTLFTPYVDSTGNVLGEFPEQTPYLEWEHSSYGDGLDEDLACQQCHMPEAEGKVVISNMPRGGQLQARSPFVQHHFVGGNAFMLKILQSEVETLGLTASTDQFQATYIRTLDQLQDKTAELSIVEAQIENNEITIILEVKNKVGHKFPTGFPSRSVWIHLVVMDAEGQIIFESGQPLPDGSIAGNDADLDLNDYEPHYDVISKPDQVQIYQAIMYDTDGNVTYTLLRAASYIKDNRLLPQGFEVGTADDSIAVWGEATGDENFIGGSDHVRYQLDLDGYSKPLTVKAEILYQSLSYRFIEDLVQDNASQIDLFLELMENANKTPVAIAVDEKTVE